MIVVIVIVIIIIVILIDIVVNCREKAIQQFNKKDSEAFIFLLSIRAAGRGLNLQSADTVVIYDPDPNPKNEEQVRSHLYE